MAMNRWSRFLHQALLPLHMIGIPLVLLGPMMAVAESATYYVATMGNDSNPGTLNQPFQTFKRAVGVLQPGDTLYIRGGVWTEQFSLAGTHVNGTATAWITISGYPGEAVTLRFTDPAPKSYGPIRARTNSYMIYQDLILDGINSQDDSGWLIVADNIIIQRVEIMRFRANGLKIGANNIKILNCKIHDQNSVTGVPGTRWYGIYHSHGSNNLIEGNEIYNNPGGGLHLYPGPISNLVVRNNVVHDNNFLTTSGVGGILVQGKSTTGVIRNTLIYNNIVYGNGMAQAVKDAPGIQVNGYTSGTKVWNNTVYGNRGYGIVNYGGLGANINTVIQNNIIYENRLAPLYTNGVGLTFDHNLTSDPKFVNPDAFDFRLQANSPATDSGVTLNEVSSDIRGILRSKNAPYDIGAYEEDVSDAKSPDAPRNMSIK